MSITNTPEKFIFLLYLITNIVLHFSKVTCIYLQEYNKSSREFISEYTKRYQSFIDFVLHFNEEMENFNLYINYLYDFHYPQNTKNPKFSLMKLLVSSNYLQIYRSEFGIIMY